MYTLLLNETNELITSQRERIMQRSKLVDNLHILVDPIYKGIPMSDFSVTMEYVLPCSKEYKTETLVKSDALYKEKLEYKLPFDTNLTKEPGDVELQLTFTKVELDEDGKSRQLVRKTSPTKITIVPISAWSDIIADSALSALDQRIIQLDAMANAMNELNQELYDTKADNIKYNEEDKTIRLTSHGKEIGDAVKPCNCPISVVGIEINGNNELIATLSDGNTVNCGKVATGDSGVFIPHIENYVLSWTNNAGLPNPEPVDLNLNDDWIEIDGEGGTSSTYVWEYI